MASETGDAKKKRVYGYALRSPEYDIQELKFGVLNVATLKELFCCAPGALFCIDHAQPTKHIFPNDDDRLLVQDHCYLMILEGIILLKGVISRPFTVLP